MKNTDMLICYLSDPMKGTMDKIRKHAEANMPKDAECWQVKIGTNNETSQTYGSIVYTKDGVMTEHSRLLIHIE